MLVRAEMEEVPTATVETLMASPLPKFIHFVANDCGYAATRFELVANWVHLLFLKTKSEASKEDNPSWEQAMNGPFKEEYREAACKKIKTLQSMEAWEAQLDWPSTADWAYASIFAVAVRFQNQDQFWIPRPKLHGACIFGFF